MIFASLINVEFHTPRRVTIFLFVIRNDKRHWNKTEILDRGIISHMMG